MAALTKTEDGGYATRDGRWTVEPVDGMGAGVNNNRGWSNGKRGWRLTDTSGAARLGFLRQPTVIVDALWRARDIIDAEGN